MDTFDQMMTQMVNSEADQLEDRDVYGLKIRWYDPCTDDHFTTLWPFVSYDADVAHSARHITQAQDVAKLVRILSKVDPTACPHSVPLAVRVVRIAEIPF